MPTPAPIAEARSPEINGAPPVIGALSTALGPAAIAIVRLSGRGALPLARSFLEGLPDPAPARRLAHAFVLSLSGRPLDEVLVASFPAPGSYTGEDVVEIHCHGGMAIARAVEARVFAAGVRQARPGEFTERAVANGKMDLLDAEALAALLLADDGRGLEGAQAQQDSVGKLRALRTRARAALAEAQGLADFPLETLGQVAAGWRAATREVQGAIDALLAAEPLDSQLRDGLTVALLGPPNAGKSSIINALAGERRSLVDAAPGTTRDAVYAPLLVSGRRITVIDTAGLRDAVGVERLGVERSLEVGAASAVRVWVEDGSTVRSEPPSSVVTDIHVWAKADLPVHPSRGPCPPEVLAVSAVSGLGIGALEAQLSAFAARPAGALTLRQRRELTSAAEVLEGVDRLSDDLAADRLRLADSMLAKLTGEALSAVEASEIYAQFCIGK